MGKIEKIEIYAWSDGTWCYVDEIGQYGHKSDDYAKISVEEARIEEAVEAFNRI